MGVWDRRAEFMRTRELLKEACPGCGTVGTLKKIIYGMPNSDFNFDRYISGGCVIFDEMPEIGCLGCEWQGLERALDRQIAEQLKNKPSDWSGY
jgi:hypothetical protein